MADTPESTPRASRPAARKPTAAKPKSAAKKPAGVSAPAAGRASSGNGANAEASNRAKARTRFNAAIEEAKAGVAALRADAADKTATYRKTATGNASEWVED